MRYELWAAMRDLVEGRRHDRDGNIHGWISGSFHEDEGGRFNGPRECLNGAIHLAEQQIMGFDLPNYEQAQTQDAAELKRVLAEVIVEQYPDRLLADGYATDDFESGDAQSVIIWFNDGIASGKDGQQAMNMILDKTETRLFEMWWDDHEARWAELVQGSDQLDELLPLV